MLIKENNRKISCIRQCKKRVWQFARVTKTEKLFDIAYHLIDALIHRKKIRWLKVKSIEQYCKDNNEVILEVESECNRIVYEPPFFETSSGKEYQFFSPSIYLAYIHDIIVVGSTGVILAKENILCDMIQRDTEHRIKWPWGEVRRVESDKVLVVVNRGVMKIDKGINLCGFASDNYYHFTMEILSRLGYINNLLDADNIPVLIDERIKTHSQLEQLLQTVNPNREVIYVPSGTCVKVQSLIQPSMNTWGILNVASWAEFQMKDNLLAKSGLINIRMQAEKYRKAQTKKKFYISRKNYTAIRLTNEADLLSLFRKEGFEIIYPETLEYMEQVGLFSSARCIVGATGAALTNIIYCHPETVIGCIIPQEYGFCVYSTLAYYLRCKVLFLNPNITYRSACIVEDEYEVDIEQCKRYIQKLNRMCL